jgi:hypothetical protein
MSSIVRLLVCVAAVAGVLAGVLLLQPVCLAGLGLDFWTLPESLREIKQANQRREELDDQDLGVSRRLCAKTDVIAALIDGQLSLKETVARFRVLNEQNVDVANNVPGAFPAATQEASVCLQVLVWAEAEAGPERETAVMSRLQEEAREILGR